LTLKRSGHAEATKATRSNREATLSKCLCKPFYKELFLCFFKYVRARKGVRMGLFDEIENMVMISRETEATEATSPKSLEKGSNKTGLSEATEATSPKSLKKPPYPNPEGRVKCVYCTHLQGSWCQVNGKHAEAISLLRECGTFTFNREQWNRDQHMFQAEGERIAEGRVNGMRHYLTRLAEGFTADTGLPVHEWCIQAGYLDGAGRFTETGLDFLWQRDPF
jgi:hypothetical protein